jgi:hypothetical protein
LIQTCTTLHRVSLSQDFWSSLNAANKHEYLLQSYCRAVPVVRWMPLMSSQHAPSHAEGHCACVLANETIVVTGGYTDDNTIVHAKAWNTQEWLSLEPPEVPLFSYGATLTTASATTAVQFGGFCNGGYSDETNQVAVLTVVENTTTGTTSATWDMKVTSGLEPQRVARAYHAATFLQNRYLLVVGGMKVGGCVMDPIVLDTNTWIWHEVTTIGEEPSARHGHSLIHDEKRQRLLLFGGGSGTDLLRSGTDKAQVFELKIGTDSNLFATPWEWRLLHDVPVDVDDESAGSRGHRETLSPAERLVLGRCHVGHKVSPDTALFAFGSGRPSTNGLIAYNLANDAFFRPNVRGPGPIPRFTCASAFLERRGYLFVHGGYATQQGTSVDDMQVLNLAPALCRNDPTFAVNPQAQNYPILTDAEAVQRGESLHQHGFAYAFHAINQFQALVGERALTVAELRAFAAAAGAVLANDDDESFDDLDEYEMSDDEYVVPGI